jgi:GT2 family glycosyltransferase
MSPAAAQASCSVVCYNHSVAQVERLLACIAGCRPRVQLYLIDNSERESLGDLARRGGAIYRHQGDNPGFGRSHNWALRATLAAGSRYHFVLNPDIDFASDVLPRLLAYMEQHPDIGLLAPRVHYPDGQLQPLCKLLPGPLDLAVRRFWPGLHRRSGRQARYELHDSGYDQVMDVPVLSGCFMLLRLGTLAQAGLFDERFFLYFEDVDLSRRIGRVARTVYYPYVAIRHDYVRGSDRTWRLLWHHSVSALRYFNKWGWLRDPERDRINAAALKVLAGADAGAGGTANSDLLR